MTSIAGRVAFSGLDGEETGVAVYQIADATLLRVGTRRTRRRAPPQEHLMIHEQVIAAAAVAALSIFGASAAVTQAGPTLDVALGPGAFDVAIETGPAAGDVRLSGVPGLPDGTLYRGVELVRYSSGAGTDTIQVRQSGTELPSIEIVHGSGGVVLDAQIEVLPTAGTVRSSLSVDAGAGGSRFKTILDSDAQGLVLDWNLRAGAGIHEVEQLFLSDGPTRALSGSVIVDLGTGQSKNGTTIKVDADVVDLDLDLDAGSSGELNLLVEQLSPGLATARVGLSGAQKLDWKWVAERSDLTLDAVVRGSALNESFNIELIADVGGTFSLNAQNGNDLANLIVKGDSRLTGVVNGSFADDEVRVLVEGRDLGAITVDGGDGFDRCSGPALVRRCEEVN